MESCFIHRGTFDTRFVSKGQCVRKNTKSPRICAFLLVPQREHWSFSIPLSASCAWLISTLSPERGNSQSLFQGLVLHRGDARDFALQCEECDQEADDSPEPLWRFRHLSPFLARPISVAGVPPSSAAVGRLQGHALTLTLCKRESTCLNTLEEQFRKLRCCCCGSYQPIFQYADAPFIEIRPLF